MNQATYNTSGNLIMTIDGDTHLGCTSGTSTFSACAKYDAIDTHLVSALNAKNQTASDLYNPTAAGGYNQWLMATKDANGQSTLYQYDVLGRLTAEADPGDTLTSPTVSYTYNNTCTVGSTDPCLEIDTTTRQTVGGSQTLTTQQWYDGQGRVVETKAPGPNLLSKVPRIGSTLVSYTIYDTMGRATTTSQTYAVASTTGTGYLTPDLTQPRTVVTYDSLGRQLTSVTYQDASTIVLKSSKSYTLAQGLSSFSTDTTTPFAQSIGLDAYNHKQVSYTDALGRAIYEQVFSGTGTASSPYAVVRTIQYAYDVVGNLLSTNTYDTTGTLVASQNTTYDGVGRKTGMNDSDSGSCRNTPLPTTCSSSSDTAWKYSYDNDGNLLSQTDPRGVSTYMSYDTMDRLLCTGTTSASVTPVAVTPTRPTSTIVTITRAILASPSRQAAWLPAGPTPQIRLGLRRQRLLARVWAVAGAVPAMISAARWIKVAYRSPLMAPRRRRRSSSRTMTWGIRPR